jgi:hypothetical protein
VLPGKYWQLAYWGEHAPQGRLPGSEKTRSGESKTVTVTLPEPARIEGTIDRAKCADAGAVCVTQRGTPWPTCESRLADGQTKFEFHDLPPGEYVVSIRSKPVRSPQREDLFTWHTLTHERVDLKPGETRDVSF